MSPASVPPQDLLAEQAVLGACMEWPQNYRTTAEILTEADWYYPAHATIWRAMGELAAQQMPADPVLLGDHLSSAGLLTRVGGAVYLMTLVQAAPMIWAPGGEHARVIADKATRRRVLQAGQRIAQQAQNAEVNTAELHAFAQRELGGAVEQQAGADILTVGCQDFMSAATTEYHALIPGLLGVGDRLVLTGMGGVGKSTALLQIAVCAAAGIHPFDWRTDTATYEPVKTTILDFENPDHRVKTRTWPLLRLAREMGRDPQDYLTLGGHGNPLNLLEPRNVLSLLRTIERDTPQLLYIGPVYKMHNGDPDKEMTVKRITDALDKVREMGVAIITEAHHTKAAKQGGSLEPSGANLWTWWCEFGLGMRLDLDSPPQLRRCALERWRIDREALDWPLHVTGGTGSWPWERCTAERRVVVPPSVLDHHRARELAEDDTLGYA